MSDPGLAEDGSELRHRKEPDSSDTPLGVSRDQLIAYAVSAALARFTLTLSDLDRTIDAARQADRSYSVLPKALEEMGRSLDGARRRAGKVAGDNLFKRLKSQFEQILPEEGSSETTSLGVGYPLPEEQIVAGLVALLGPNEISDTLSIFRSDCKDDAETAHYALAYMQWKYRSPLTDHIGRTVVPAVTAALEEPLAALLRLWLTLYPEALSVPKSQVEVGEAVAYKSGQDIMRAAIDNKIRESLRGSPMDWRELLATRRGIDLGELTDAWNDICEIFARRHVLVHWGGRVDAKYLERLPRGIEAPALGERSVTDASYAKRAIGLISYLGTCLAITWLALLVPKGAAPAQLAGDYLYRALKERHFRDAYILADATVSGRELDDMPPVVVANWFMARRDYCGDTRALRSEIEAWQPPVEGYDYQIAKAALLRNDEQLLTALKEVARANPEDLRRLSDWPLLTDMAERSGQVQALLHQVGGPPSRRQTRRPSGKKRRR
jgi:hypothetical protein